jgi:hypothetical protein
LWAIARPPRSSFAFAAIRSPAFSPSSSSRRSPAWMKRRESRVASTAVSLDDEPFEPEELDDPELLELDAGNPLSPIPTVPE